MIHDNLDEICCVCNREAEQECQRCKISYCSKDCQQLDWTRHRFTCLPMPYLIKKQSNSMRPPQLTTMTCKSNESQTSVESTVSTGSIFNNPFKKNSKNIGFQSNDVRNIFGNVFDVKSNSLDQTSKKELPNEIKKISGRIIKASDKFDITQLGGFKKILNSESIRKPVNVKTLAAAEPIKTSTQSNGVDYVTTSTELLSMAKPKQEQIDCQQREKKPEIASTELLFTTKQKQEQTDRQQREKNSILTMNDIEIVPISLGKKLQCLDFGNIGEGYVSACVYNQKAITHIDKLSAKITEYCKRTNEAYCPQANELCLCRYKEDGQWYRAVVERVIDSNTFEIEFFDFGNKASVKCADIRKMSQEFMHHCLANKCYLKHFPENPSKDEVLKMAIFFNENTIFDVKALDDEDGRYVIEVKY